jgi:hypothetical protein
MDGMKGEAGYRMPGRPPPGPMIFNASSAAAFHLFQILQYL